MIDRSKLRLTKHGGDLSLRTNLLARFTIIIMTIHLLWSKIRKCLCFYDEKCEKSDFVPIHPVAANKIWPRFQAIKPRLQQGNRLKKVNNVFSSFPRQILILITIVSMASRLPWYVFCICLLTNKYQKYKSVELGDQLQHGQHQHCHHFDLLNPCQSKSSPGLPCSSCVLVGRSAASSPLSCRRSSLHTGAVVQLVQ